MKGRRRALERKRFVLHYQSTVDVNTGALDHRVLARVILSIGHSLDLKVVAEGVGTEAQLDYLRKRGCDEVQGYYFSRPVPPEAFRKLLDA